MTRESKPFKPLGDSYPAFATPADAGVVVPHRTLEATAGGTTSQGDTSAPLTSHGNPHGPTGQIPGAPGVSTPPQHNEPLLDTPIPTPSKKKGSTN